MWICPHCRKNLTAGEEKTLICSDGHSYDVAREGYVNLLLANRKGSLEPGDSKEMLAARQRVHESELYQPLAAAIQAQIAQLPSVPSQILDIGCGEGYYGAALQAALPAASIFGIDIAKPAIKLAARKYREGHFAVASMSDVPLADSSLDLITNIFAPAEERELSRLLRPDGWYLKITPAALHLWELRTLLYNHPKPHKEEPLVLTDFVAVAETPLQYRLQLSSEMLRDVVAMTPYAHRGDRENREKLNRNAELSLQMSFNISLWQRRPVSASLKEPAKQAGSELG